MTTQKIREFGLSLGYSAVGVTSADGFPDYRKEVLSRGEPYYDNLGAVGGCMPRDMMPEAKSVIVLAWDYYQKEYPENLKKLAGKLYLNRSYIPRPDNLNHARLELMKKYLADAGITVREDIPVPARWAAVQAGIATFGRNNFAYVEGCGSYVVLTTLVVDAELEPGTPSTGCPCPPDCTACVDACPTKALYKAYHLHPEECVAFNHWMTQNWWKGYPDDIPVELREGMGCRIHGCDACQDACPRNQAKLHEHKAMDPFTAVLAEDITLPAVLRMDDDFYKARIEPIMYNYIRGGQYFRRNAAVAMGNSGDLSYVPDLITALEEDESEIVRGHAAWALGRLGGAQAREALENRLTREDSEKVRGEIAAALA